MKLGRDWLKDYPAPLIDALAASAGRHGATFYITGGAVRDWLVGAVSHDLDITVSGAQAFACARTLAKGLFAAFVPLDEKEGVARVVWQGYEIDLCDLREGTKDISADLKRRDFSINAMAVEFSPPQGGILPPYTVIDPLNGGADLRAKLIRATADDVFDKDPLRLLRAHRFAAKYGFSIDPQTSAVINGKVELLNRAAPERIRHELADIILSPRAADTFAQMAANGMLWQIFPELEAGCGMAQPAGHHLDVFNHNLTALLRMEEIIAAPEKYFSENLDVIKTYLAHDRRRLWLKWAALFHDVGKPAKFALIKERLTFYNHDQEGSRIFAAIGRRLRFGGEDIKQICRFINFHMWPFHLQNSLAKTGITAKACLKFVKAVEAERHGLFILAMADGLAAEGDGKSGGEPGLIDLYNHIETVYYQSIKPVLSAPQLINGNDLIAAGLTPGPEFKNILTALQQEQVEGGINSREQALAWLDLRVTDLGARGEG